MYELKDYLKAINETKEPLLDSDDLVWERSILLLLLTDVCLCSMIQLCIVMR